MKTNMNELYSYSQIKADLLDGFFNELRNNIYRKKNLSIYFSCDEILAKMYDDFEKVYDHPLEKFMLYIIFIVLSDGFGVNNAEFFYKKFCEIQNEIKKNHYFFQSMSEEERLILNHDLNLLSLNID